MSFRIIILFCALLCASAAAEAQERSFADVVDWVRRDGKPNTVWDVAIAMKIQTGANRAVQKIIVKMDLKRFYGMQVYDDQTDVIMSISKPASASSSIITITSVTRELEGSHASRHLLWTGSDDLART